MFKNPLQLFKEYSDRNGYYSETINKSGNSTKPMFTCSIIINGKEYVAVGECKKDSRLKCILMFNSDNKNILKLTEYDYKKELTFSRLVSTLKTVGATFESIMLPCGNWQSSVAVMDQTYSAYGTDKRSVLLQATIRCAKGFLGIPISHLLEMKLQYGSYERALRAYCARNACTDPKFHFGLDSCKCLVYKVCGNSVEKYHEIAFNTFTKLSKEAVSKKILHAMLH